MKKEFMLAIFLAFTITLASTTKEVANLRKVSQQDDDLMKQLFTAMPSKCESPEAAFEKAQEEAQKMKKSKDKSFLKSSKADLWWVKKWGYEYSAYFFDFLDPVLLSKFVEEATKMYKDALATDNTKDGNYVDPFDYKNFITSEMEQAEKDKFLKDFKLINANYVKEIFDISINAVQLHKVMKDWKWIKNASGDYSRDLIDNYDADGDGRLNVREFILASIDSNRSNFGKSGVKNLFNELVAMLNAIFTFIDCNEDGFLSAEEVWKNLKNLKRPNPDDYNIFGANESIRITSVNDFFKKTHESKNGLLNKEEFTAGILLGLWNRQVEKTKILSDDSRSLAKLRWENRKKDKAFLKSLAR